MSNTMTKPGESPANVFENPSAIRAMESAAKLVKRCEGMNQWELASGCLAYVANLEEKTESSAVEIFGIEPQDAGSETEWLRRKSWFYDLLRDADWSSGRPATGIASYLEDATPGQKKLARYLELKSQERAIKAELDELNAELKVDIGEDGERITLGDYEATVTRQTSHRIDAKLARKILSDDYLEAITVSSVSTVLRVVKIKEDD